MVAVCVRTTATIAGARVAVQVYIGFGDAITPAVIDIDHSALLDTGDRTHVSITDFSPPWQRHDCARIDLAVASEDSDRIRGHEE